MRVATMILLSACTSSLSHAQAPSTQPVVAGAVAESVQSRVRTFRFWADYPAGTFICPGHHHGTAEQATEAAARTRRSHGSGTPFCMWVCRANQVATLERFARAADLIFVTPFVLDSEIGPGDDDNVWPKFDHRGVNQVRRLRKAAGDTALVACIDIQADSARPEPRWLGKRHASIDEVLWMVYAVIGANYQGIVWRGNAEGEAAAKKAPSRPLDPAMLRAVRRLEADLRPYADELGRAKPANWLTWNGDNVQMTALASPSICFVVILSTQYMTPYGGDQMIAVPLEPRTLRATLELRPSAGIVPVSGRTLSGRKLAVQANDDAFTCEIDVASSAEMLIFELVTKQPDK